VSTREQVADIIDSGKYSFHVSRYLGGPVGTCVLQEIKCFWTAPDNTTKDKFLSRDQCPSAERHNTWSQND
jgi:hypothetical protein